MQFWRVTKYNPRHRNRRGHYKAEDWSSVSDIGRVFNGETLTVQDYLKTESAYTKAALDVFTHSGQKMTVTALEMADRPWLEDTLKTVDLGSSLELDPALERAQERQALSPKVFETLTRLCLRELLWLRFSEPGRASVHFGYDYYMYFASNLDLTDCLTRARQNGLFVESLKSQP